ncbi:MAG: hypothetical protein MRZ82_04245 [Firmicutes bacterium]|nr:hypothetical protein [Bacillota bacterium]
MRHHDCSNSVGSCDCREDRFDRDCDCDCREDRFDCGCDRRHDCDCDCDRRHDCDCDCDCDCDRHHDCDRDCDCDCSCGCEPCLGRVCGTSIDTDDVDFTRSQPNLVYMDKVYSYNQATSCPILFNLDTGRTPSGTFNVDIELSEPLRKRGCGCGETSRCRSGNNCDCCTCNLNSDAVFTVESGTACLNFISTRPQGCISPEQLTIDGFEVDSLKFSNGLFTAGVADILPKIQKRRCINAGLPTKHFFLLRDVGPWDIRATFTLFGTVNSGGRTCRFTATFTLDDDAPNICVPNRCPSGFAIPNLSLPCTANGFSPDINFQFGGKLKMVNPEICIRNNRHSDTDDENSCGCEGGSSRNTPILVTQLVLEPSIHAEAVRRTLFCVNACEGRVPCGPASTELSIESTECRDPFAPDCVCGSRHSSVSPSSCDCDERDDCRDHRDHRPSAFQFNGCNGCTW